MMTWLPGWADSHYRQFFFLVAIALATIGILLSSLRLFPQTKSFADKVWVSFSPWFIMAPIAFLAVGAPQKIFILCLVVLSIFASKEFARATGLYKDWDFMGIVYLSIAGFYFSAWTGWHDLFCAMPVYALTLILMVPIFRNEYQHMLQKSALAIITVIYFGWFPAHLAFLGEHPQRYAYLLFLIIGTEWNDASAYLAGKIFGKTPLIANISPKKTVEGSLGALALSALFVFSVRNWLPEFNAWALGLSLILFWIGGTIGDLVISFIKRDIGVKDMGNLIPGHGGLLDRVDSLIFVAPLYFHLISYFIGFPGGLN